MDVFFDRLALIFRGVVLITIFGYLAKHFLGMVQGVQEKQQSGWASFFSIGSSSAEFRGKIREKDRAASRATLSTRNISHDSDVMDFYKELYFKLQNLEVYPEILPKARDALISMFAEALAAANSEGGILSIKEYSRDALSSFMQKKEDGITEGWQQYIERRKSGAPRELFQDATEAKWWLKQSSPVRYVDGAWLGHINKVSTPFDLRQITKHAWQVLSEELGDGDQAKNHVHLYRELMREIKAGLPDGDTADFIHPKTGIDQPRVWKAAVSQLLISLFPHEFLPEILGFNLSFEGITMETLMAAKELEELKINPYYFVLHITIDNADSGHTAMALHATAEYIEHVRCSDGELAAQQAWKRVQTGFVLSESLPTTPICQSAQKRRSEFDNPWAAEITKIFKAKAVVAHKIHCNTGFKLDGRTLVDWLEPTAFESPQWQKEFLDALSNRKPWVYRGDSKRSKLVHELSWGGKMFGSFTREEIEVVKHWIDSLPVRDPGYYWSFVGRNPVMLKDSQQLDVAADYPVFSCLSFSTSQLLSLKQRPPNHALSFDFRVTTSIDMSKFLPLWFAHPCLLESFVSVPFEASSPATSLITRILRAQFGFGIEGPWVDGMDEIRRSGSVGLLEIGLEIMERAGEGPRPSSLKEMLVNRHSDFALRMLHLSMRPKENAALLLGLCSAFIDLHAAIAESSLNLVSKETQALLGQIAARERESLDSCCDLLFNSQKKRISREDFQEGYLLGKASIRGCLEIPEC